MLFCGEGVGEGGGGGWGERAGQGGGHRRGGWVGAAEIARRGEGRSNKERMSTTYSAQDSQQLAGTRWRLDPSGSSAEFRVPNLWGLTSDKGRFQRPRRLARGR